MFVHLLYVIFQVYSQLIPRANLTLCPNPGVVDNPYSNPCPNPNPKEF